MFFCISLDLSDRAFASLLHPEKYFEKFRYLVNLSLLAFNGFSVVNLSQVARSGVLLPAEYLHLTDKSLGAFLLKKERTII